MKKTSFNYKLIAIILVLCLFSMYIVYQAVLYSKADIETQPALKDTVYKTIDTKAFVVRNEEFITSNANGTSVSFAKNGERVALGDTVSIVFDSADDASSFLKISELEKRVQHYEELAGQANIQAINIDSINKKIDNELIEYLENIDNKTYKKAVQYAEKYRDTLTGKQIATGTALDVTKQLAEAKNELVELKQKKYSFTEIKSDKAGYYINGYDGYENTIDFEKIDELTIENIEKAIDSKSQNIPSNVVGRVVESFEWYILCSVPSDKTVNLTAEKTLYVNIPNEGIERLPVSLHKIGDRDASKTMLILRCDVMNEELSDIRIEDIQIVTEEYTGYKISNSSIRTVDGVKGVYIVRGNLLGFRKIHIVYSTDTFTIVDNPNGETNYIKQYDEVVTKGVELYDNKLV